MRAAITSIRLLLVMVSVAHAESAWVLWESHTVEIEGRPTAWRRLAGGTEAECQRAAFDAASVTYIKWYRHNSRHLGDVVREGTRVRVPAEFESWTITYVCLLDTVDPSGPNEGK